jgi:hypothetical protein
MDYSTTVMKLKGSIDEVVRDTAGIADMKARLEVLDASSSPTAAKTVLWITGELARLESSLEDATQTLSRYEAAVVAFMGRN